LSSSSVHSWESPAPEGAGAPSSISHAIFVEAARQGKWARERSFRSRPSEPSLHGDERRGIDQHAASLPPSARLAVETGECEQDGAFIASPFDESMILQRGRSGFNKDDRPDRVRHDIGIAASSRPDLGCAARIGISGRHWMVVGQRTPSASPDTGPRDRAEEDWVNSRCA
jgi:hypothetical protein